MPMLLRPTHDDLRGLFEAGSGPRVSIYLPMNRAGKDTRGNHIRFKNAIREAKGQLEALNKSLPALDQLESETDDGAFWQHQGHGLAVLIDENETHWHQLPTTVDELVIVSDTFHLLPLIAHLTSDVHFFICAVSEKQLRVFEATRHEIWEVDSDGLPESARELQKFIDGEKSIQHYTLSMPGSSGPAAIGGRGTPMFHGQGSIKDQEKMRIGEYFAMLDEPLGRVIRNAHTPVIFAGVEHHFPIFKEHVKSVHVHDKAVQGNFDAVRASADEIHRKALDALQPTFVKERVGVIDRFKAACGTDNCITEVKDVIARAQEGRVQSLLVACDAHTWGTYGRNGERPTRHKERQTGDADLLNVAATLAQQRGAEVHVVGSELMPNGEGAIAILHPGGER